MIQTTTRRAIAEPPNSATARPPRFFFLGTERPDSVYPLKYVSDWGTSDVWEPEPLGAFQEAIVNAKSHIRILDPQFNVRVGLRSIWAALALSEARDVRILGLGKRPSEWMSEQEYGQDMVNRLQWRTAPNWLHGRFAFVDAELWHFGSTVGGGHPCFDAASCWCDPHYGEQMDYLFNDAWRTAW